MIIRELELKDYGRGFCETLNTLSPCELTYAEYHHLWYRMVHFQGDWRHVYVMELDEKVVACATLLTERKFSHYGGIAAHIEDVAVRLDYQKRGLGKAMVNHLIDLARQRGCYTVVLECASWNIEFYEKLGFKQHGTSMRYDL